MRRIVMALVLSLTGSAASAQTWSDPPPPYGPPSPYGSYGPPSPYGYGPPPISHRGGRWQQLLSRPTPEPGVDVVVFRGKGGRLGLLRIAPIGGVSHVVVEYDRRPPQVIEIDRWTRRGPEQVIAVDRGARIQQIVIYSRGPHRHTYAVWGA